jgi:hypothetical protein
VLISKAIDILTKFSSVTFGSFLQQPMTRNGLFAVRLIIKDLRALHAFMKQLVALQKNCLLSKTLVKVLREDTQNIQ